jgi:radical SAM protein with 4Fe4S-binding SPASM domain
MAMFQSRRLPEECLSCGKADLGCCPYHMGERRSLITTQQLRRGLRRLLPIDGHLPDGRSIAPDVAVLLPTLRCNLHCPYCFQRDQGTAAQHHQEKDILSLSEWQSVIDELASIQPQVIVMGGELFLFPEALDLLRAVKAADLHLSIITNGIALPQVADELLSLGLDRLIVSIDGPARIHNRVRGHPHGYELATAGIERMLVGRGVCPSPFVQVSCTVSSHTQAHLGAFVETMGSLGVDRIVLNNLIYATAGQVAAQGEHLRRSLQFSRASMALNHHAQDGIDATLLRREMAAIRCGPWSDLVFVAPPGTERHPEAYYAPDAPPFRNQFCTAVYRELWVLPNGDVSACGHIHELSMGNVRQESVLKAWNSPDYRRLRRYLAQGLLPACSRCEKLDYHHPPA